MSSAFKTLTVFWRQPCHEFSFGIFKEGHIYSTTGKGKWYLKFYSFQSFLKYNSTFTQYNSSYTITVYIYWGFTMYAPIQIIYIHNPNIGRGHSAFWYSGKLNIYYSFFGAQCSPQDPCSSGELYCPSGSKPLILMLSETYSNILPIFSSSLY